MRALGIFVKAPIPGRVMTRLAGDIGPSGAAEVYWRLGRQVIAATVGSGERTTVWFTPPGEGAFVREWLAGFGRLAFRPQVGTNLGDRLRGAFAREFFDGARRVVIVGSDCPGLNRRLVAEAFNALGECDLVLGPALDGGCYLIGLSEPRPGLLRAVPWSTAAAAVQAGARARSLGLACRVLRPLRDVNTARDARMLGLLDSRPI